MTFKKIAAGLSHPPFLRLPLTPGLAIADNRRVAGEAVPSISQVFNNNVDSKHAFAG